MKNAIKGMFTGAALFVAGAAHADEIVFIGPSISAGEASGLFQLVDNDGNTIVLEKAHPPFAYDLTDMAIFCEYLLDKNGFEIARGHLLYFIEKHLSRDYGTHLDDSIGKAAKLGAGACHAPNIS